MSILSLFSLIRQTRFQTNEFTQFSQELPSRSRSSRKRVQKPTNESHDSQSETNLAEESISSELTTKDDSFRDRFNIHRFSSSQQSRQVQMSSSSISVSIYNTAQNSSAVSEEDSSSRGRTLRSSSNLMSTVSSLKPSQTSSRSLYPSLEETSSTVRSNASSAVEMTFASNSQDSNAEVKAKFNAQSTQNIQFIVSSSRQRERPYVSSAVERTFASNSQDSNAEAKAESNVQSTQNIQLIASSSRQRESQAIQSSQINPNSTSLEAFRADLEQQGYNSDQIAQTVFIEKEKGKMTIENDEATFHHSAFDNNGRNSDEIDSNDITEEDKQQKSNMLNSAVSIETKIEMSPKILSIYHEIREDLKALWLDSDDSRVINELKQSNEDIINMNRRIYSNDASFQGRHQISILNIRSHIRLIRQIHNRMQQSFENTSIVRRDSQIVEATKFFFVRMRELRISVLDTVNSTIQANLMTELVRTGSETVSESNMIVSLEDQGQMIAPSSVRGIMPHQSMYYTSWEIVTDVTSANALDSRVLVNADTKNLPRYFIYSEAFFEKRVTKNWLNNALLTSVMQRANAVQRLWTDIARVDYMMKVMANSESWNAIDYVHLIYKENNSQSHLRKEEWQTKSGFFSIANKQQEDMMLRRIAEQDEQTARDWALCKIANIHSETRLSLTDQEKEEMSWLTSQHYVPFQTITDDTVTHEESQTRSQLQQPAFSTSQSAFTAQQSMLAAQSSELATQQPAYFTQSAPSISQPEHFTQQPAYFILSAPSISQPAHLTQQSAYFTLPAPSISQPAHLTQQPAYFTQSASSISQSAPSTQQFVLPNQLSIRQSMQSTTQTQSSASATSTPSIIQSTYHALFLYQARDTTEISLDQRELIIFLLDQENDELQ